MASEYLVTYTLETSTIIDETDIEDGYTVFDVAEWGAEDVPFDMSTLIVRVERIPA